MRRFRHQQRAQPQHDAGRTDSSTPGAGRAHRSASRVKPPPASPVPCATHYIAMPDAESRDALEQLVADWCVAAALTGESLVQYGRRCFFTDDPPRGRKPFGLITAHRVTVTEAELERFGLPVVRIDLYAPDTLESISDLVERWAGLAHDSAAAFIAIGRLRLFGHLLADLTAALSTAALEPGKPGCRSISKPIQ